MSERVSEAAGTKARTPEDLIRFAYRNFNQRDIDAVLSTMHIDVDWPNGMEGGRVVGHEAVRDYWTRQWKIVDPNVEPVGFSSAPDGRTIVKVHQRVCDPVGRVLLDHMIEHIYEIRGDLIQSMEIKEID